MPITDKQAEWLEEFFQKVGEHHDVLRGDREQKFVDDQRERYEKYGTKMFLSPAQLKWLQDIQSRFPGEGQDLDGGPVDPEPPPHEDDGR